jgi:glycerol-3-phosphate cytidylyltransferase-like family protein
VGKAKQTFEMFGTALYIMYGTRYVGLILLTLALPLAYESVRRKIVSRVMYAHGASDNFDYTLVKFWMQVKAMGSKLVVCFPASSSKGMVLNACSCSSVDQVIADAPDVIDLKFLESQGIDYVICMADTKSIAGDVLKAKKCLQLHGDGIVRPLAEKMQEKVE